MDPSKRNGGDSLLGAKVGATPVLQMPPEMGMESGSGDAGRIRFKRALRGADHRCCILVLFKKPRAGPRTSSQDQPDDSSGT